MKWNEVEPQLNSSNEVYWNATKWAHCSEKLIFMSGKNEQCYYLNVVKFRECIRNLLVVPRNVSQESVTQLEMWLKPSSFFYLYKKILSVEELLFNLLWVYVHSVVCMFRVKFESLQQFEMTFWRVIGFAVHLIAFN